MKHLKIISVLLSAAMCFSMVTAPVMADEMETPSETQTTEASDEKDAEAEEPEEEEPEVVEDKGEPEAEDQRDAEDAYLAKGKCGKKLKWTLDKKGTLKITGKGAMYDYKLKNGLIPNSPWAKYMSKIKKVVITKGVTTVGAGSFSSCESLTSISLSKTVKSIRDLAFARTGLRKVVLPKSLKTIGECAFLESNLESVYIPKGVTAIYDSAFSNTPLKSVSIPSSVKTIGEYAIDSCRILSSVSISNGVTSIGSRAFSYSALQKVVIPASVKSIGESAFECCVELETVKINDMHLTSIGNRAFASCMALTEFEVPLSVTSIGEYAFSKCGKLGRVWINVDQKDYLPSNAFDKSPNVYFDENTYNLIGKQFGDGKIGYFVSNPAINGTGTVDVLAIDPEIEKIVIPSVVEDNGVKYKVTKITGYTSQYNPSSKMKILVIGSNVTTIADKAFANCPELISVTGGARLVSVGARAFEKCPKLKVFSISSKSLKKIGAYAFNADKALTTLQLKKTTKLSKSGVKKSLKGSSVKTVKVKKSKVKKYKKIFKNKNCGKKVKVKK